MATGKIEKVTNDHSWGNPAYCKFPDGTLLEWGAATIPNHSYSLDITLPVQVASLSHCSIQLTPLQNDTDYNVDYSASSNTKIRIGRKPYDIDNTYYWILVGRWK